VKVRIALLAAVLVVLAAAPSAWASFGFGPGSEGFDVAATDKGGSPANQAGTHPYAIEVDIGLNATGGFSDGDLRDLHLELPPGLLTNPTAVPECTQAQFQAPRSSPYETSMSGESCPNQSQIGVVAVHSAGGSVRHFGVFNLVPPYGAPAAIGFAPYGTPIVLTPRVRESDAGLTLDLDDLSQSFDVQALDLTIWGTPWVLDHDSERGNCLNETDPSAYHGELSSGSGLSFHAGTCTVGSPYPLSELTKSYLTLPTAPCGAPLSYAVSATSWAGEQAQASVQGHDGEGHPALLTGCNKALTVPKVQLTSEDAAVGSGLVFNLDVNDGGGILNQAGIARPAIRNAVVSMPQGLTINPSVGAGLGVCSADQFASFSLASPAACPNASKVGTVEVRGMLGLSEPLTGSLYIATPYANPFGSLLALYMVASNPRRGLFVKSLGKIEPDPATGKLVATFEDLPRLLYTHFNLSFREGQRAMVISPPSCGDYAMGVDLASWAQPDVFTHDSASFFRIAHGRAGAPCPSAPGPFTPVLDAGSLNSNAGSYTPFYLHMTRSDADQEITSYSATFPPGMLGRLAGIPYCPEAAIAAAELRSGAEEIAHPSCPAASSVGHTLAGYGVGSVLAYAPGGLYLAGPYHGAPLSIVAIDAAQVGPFDLGVVVVRSAIRINPETAQAAIDSSGSDPIPHILRGIPIHLRDIRVYVDRPGFMVNGTSCDPTATLSTLTGAGTDVFSPADDVAATASDRYQLSDCAALGFKPKLSISLGGVTRRAGYPSLRTVVVPRPGDANIASAAVTLPPALFLAQEHIVTICTRRQFAANACPAGSIYGHVRAFTPLLEKPMEGPVYVRASDHQVPDLVFALRGPGGLEVDLAGRIDSARGGIRASFATIPDAPVTKFVLRMPGGKRGILSNSANFCAGAQFATARLTAHNNKGTVMHPRLRVHCAKHRKHGTSKREGKE